MPKLPVPRNVNAVISATAIVSLCQIGQFDVLKKLYDKIIIPKTVFEEICANVNSDAAIELNRSSGWVVVAEPKKPINKALYGNVLHKSEAEMLAIAWEMKNEEQPVLVIVDDEFAKNHAKASGIKATGTLGVIYRARKEGHLGHIAKGVSPLLQSMDEKNVYVGKRNASYFKARRKKTKKVLSKKDKWIVNALTVAIIVLAAFFVYEATGYAIYLRDLQRNRRIAEQVRELLPPGWHSGLNDRELPLRGTLLTEYDFRALMARLDQGEALTPEELNTIFLGPPPEPPQLQPIQEILNLRNEFNNNDIVAVFALPGTVRRTPFSGYIAYGPVAQGLDNDYYLRRGLDGRRNFAGSLFLDYRNSPMLTDHNTIVYGHNMQDRSMFGNLRYYTSASTNAANFARDYQYITVVTLYEVTMWRIYAAYKIVVEPLEFYYIRPNFHTRQAHQEFLDEIRRRASAPIGPWGGNGGFFYFDYGVNPDDRILTLSTCTNIHDGHRYAIHAVLVYVNGVQIRS